MLGFGWSIGTERPFAGSGLRVDKHRADGLGLSVLFVPICPFHAELLIAAIQIAWNQFCELRSKRCLTNVVGLAEYNQPIGYLDIVTSDTYEAISDYSDAIKHKKRELQHSLSYQGRAEAYLRSQQWVDRWREIEQASDETIYIDMRTFDDRHIDAIKIWIKELGAPRNHAKSKESWSQDGEGPHELTQYELNCIARRLRSVSSVSYDISGNVVGHRAGGGWDVIVPDTLGETLYNGACKHN